MYRNEFITVFAEEITSCEIYCLLKLFFSSIDMSKTNEQNVGLDATSGDVRKKSASIDQPNGDLKLGKEIDDKLDNAMNLDLRPDVSENAGNGDKG